MSKEKENVGALSKAASFQEFYFTICVLIVLCTQTSSALSSANSTKRYKVLRLHAASDNDLKVIRELQSSHQIDPWRQIFRASGTGDYMVSPDVVDSFLEKLQDNNIQHDVLIDNVEKFVQDNAPVPHQNRLKRAASVHEFRHKFLTYPELRHFLRHVSNTATNAHVELGTTGRSYEGRPTPYVKISGQNNSLDKDAIFIDAGVHSREWISPAMTVEIIHRLAFNTENDTDINDLLNMFDWIIVPLVNPDGYAFTFRPGMQNRLWRKSRSTAYSGSPGCYGVDLNRNFGFAWNNTPIHGGSSNPCSGTFSGPSSFSEPESQNLRNLLLSYKDKIKAYLSFHSFGQFFLYPWGYSSDVDLEDEDDLHHLASAFADTMRQKNYVYHVGGSAKVLYPAAGASDDYVRGTVGVKYAYTVELPPHERSSYGFLLPESNVNSVVTDTWEGLKDFAYRLYEHQQKSGGASQASHGETVSKASIPNHQSAGHLDNASRRSSITARVGSLPRGGLHLRSRVATHRRATRSNPISWVTVPGYTVTLRRPQRSTNRVFAEKRRKRNAVVT